MMTADAARSGATEGMTVAYDTGKVRYVVTSPLAEGVTLYLWATDKEARYLNKLPARLARLVPFAAWNARVADERDVGRFGVDVRPGS